MDCRSALPFVLFVILAGAGTACSDQTISRGVTPPAVGGGPEAPAEDDALDDAGDVDAGAREGSAPVDAAPDTRTPPAGHDCTTTFGHALTPDHGRLDGTVRAVVLAGDADCKSDNDHAIVQIDVVEGAQVVTYPIWVNIESNLVQADPYVRVAQKTAPLVGPAWVSGWHPSVALDYATTLGVHSGGAFAVKTRSELGTLLDAALPKGAKVSAFMYGFQTADGGHKTHRNATGFATADDGALVVLGQGTPRWLLFHFSQQLF